jgi:hypothetical protein
MGMPGVLGQFVEQPHVDFRDGRPYAVARLGEDYADHLERLALEKESGVMQLPVSPGWQPIADKNPTTARYASYSAFLLSEATLPLFFAIRETYLCLLQVLNLRQEARFIQCWYNIHRAGDALVRHKHPYAFIGTFSAHAEGSETRYGRTRETNDSDVIVRHRKGQLMVTTGPEHYHETSVWHDPARPRVTYAFDILDAKHWHSRQMFLPFDF